MVPVKNQDLFETSIPKAFSNQINFYQDRSTLDLEKRVMMTNITNNQREFIVEKNKYFFEEFKKLYSKNILLRKRLNELLTNKKELHQQIIKQEHEEKKSKKKTKNEEKDKNNCINKTKQSFFEVTDPYFKKKRQRRKKCELITKHNCFYPNCNKSYPSKSSLNMHIKLKHLPQKSTFFFNSNNK